MTKYLVYLILLLSLHLNLAAQTIVLVGPSGGEAFNLKEAFDAINNGDIQGEIILQIVDNTAEFAPAILYQSGYGGNSNYSSVTLYPTAAGLKIGGNLNNALIELNGATNVTFDGRVNHSGAANLTISNTSTGSGASTIRFVNSAQSNTVKYCNIRGAQTDGAGGIIFFSTSVSGTGNDNNNIDNNFITSETTGRPYNAIFSSGTAGRENSSNVISSNSIFNFLNLANASNGILISLNSTVWSISGNSFYETLPFNPTLSVAYSMLRIDNPSGDNFTIEGNFIGGQAPLCGGPAWDKSNSSNNSFVAILLNAGTSVPSNIQNNIIQSFNWRNSSSASWTAIQIAGGSANVGTVTGNLIGSSTGNGSITLTGGSANTNVYGINISGTGTTDCRNNTIGSITAASSNANNSTNFYAINKANVGGTTTISNNSVGSSVTANSINVSSASLGNTQIVYGISNSGTGNTTISNNSIQNLNNNTTNALGVISGIYFNGGTGTNAVRANFINNISTANNPTSATAYGIRINSGSTVYSNNIISLGGNTPSTLFGIFETGSAGNNNSLYFNTVYIGGSPSSGTNKSYALYSALSSNTRNFRNNILMNSRTTAGGSNLHYAVWLNYSVATNLTLDYNDYYVTGTGGTLGYFNSTNLTAIPLVAGNDVHSLTMNPLFANGGGVVSSDYLPSEPTLAAITGTGILTDYTDVVRSVVYPSMGAFEYAVTPCYNPSVGGTIGTAQTGCSPYDPGELESLSPASGHTGPSIEYMWQISITGSGSGFSDIPSTNALTYDPVVLTQNSWFRRLARVTCKTDWVGAATSNVIAITVNTPPVAGPISGASSVCMGATLSLNSNASGTPLLNYTWHSSDPSVALVDNSGIVTPVSAGITNISYTVTDGNTPTCSATSSSHAVTVNLLPAKNLVVEGSGALCTGNSAIITVSLSESGVNYQLRNSSGNTNVGLPVIGTGGTISLPTGTLNTTTTFNILATNPITNCSVELTETETITIDPLSIGGSLTGSPGPITYGSSTGILSLSGETGSVVKWQKMSAPGTWEDISNNSTTYSESPSAKGIWQYRVQVKSGVCSDAFSSTFSITVDPKNLTIEANSQTKTFGTVFTFAGTEFSASGLVFSDEVTSVTLASSGSPVGASVAGSPYPIVPSAALGSGLTNYAIAYTSGLLTVTRANQSISFGALSGVPYGIADFSPGASASSGLTISYASDNPSVATIVGGNIHITGVGLATITASQPGNSDYFPATAISQPFSVSKANLTFTARSETREYLSANPVLAYTVSGFVYGETEAVLDALPSVSTNALITSPVGTYVISVSGGSDNNYNYLYVPGILNVTKKSQTLVFDRHPEQLMVSDTFKLVASNSSGQEVLFESSDNLLATVEGNVLTGVKRGVVQIRAYNPGNENYLMGEVFTSVEITSTHKDIMYLFTPNGDGFNDYWELPELEIWGKCDVMVYSRSGKLVYSVDNYNNLWDGTTNGNPLPEGPYYFIINTQNEGMIKGTVNIVR